MNLKLRQLLMAFALLAGLLIVPSVPGSPPSVAQAAGTPNVSLAKEMPAEMLYGVPIPVTLTMTNPGGPDGFNTLFTDVLPAGVDFVSGTPTPSIISQTDGTTLLVWSNAADILTGATVTLDYVIEADQSVFSSGDTVTNSAQAFVQSNPRVLPKLNESSTNLSGNAVLSTYTGSDSASASTVLIPFELSKTGGTAENELLRGVHDQQTVYTLTVDNNAVNTTTGFALVDYLPASLEFLGCQPIVDNSTFVEEYPGSGIIPAGVAPPVPPANPCVTPSSVTTVDTDPDGEGPMPVGVYTRVEWDSASLAGVLGTADLLAGESFSIDYVTAIPLQRNTFPGPTPATANLDNNTGSYTTELSGEEELRNYAEATGTYFTDGSPTSDSDIDAATIEDFSIHKTVDMETFTQDSTPIFTLLVESSEYALSTGPITVTDTIPATLDFVSAVPAPDDLAGVDNGDGTIKFTWTLPEFTAPNSSATITLNTDVRERYRGATTPVASNDSYTNIADVAANVTVITDNTGTTEVLPLGDESAASQSAPGPTILKDVSVPSGVGTLTCGDGAGISFDPVSTGDHRPGDRVCYRLKVNFPAELDTINPIIDDYLPDGFVVESWAAGANNNVDFTGATVPVAPYTDDVPLMRWDLSDIDRGGRIFEVVIQTVISDSSETVPGDIADNLMKLRYSNASGGVFQQRDAALAVLSEAILDLDKGVIELNGAPVAGAPADGTTVQEGDTVTYQVAVSNTGNEPASKVSVRDVLPVGIACTDVVGATISNGGTCVTATAPLTDYIQWDTDDGIAIAAAGTFNLTYDVIMASGISAGATLTNTAGVRQYSGETNSGTPFVYVPENNIDTTLTPNTDPADDTSNVVTALPTITKTRTTLIDEPGNAASNQATIGETVSYTIDYTLPGGTTFFNAVIDDELFSEKDLVESTVIVKRDDVVVIGGPAPTGFQINTTDNTVNVIFPTPYEIPRGPDQDFQIKFDVIITDVASNTRTTSSPNRVDFDFQNAAGEDRNINDSVGLQIVEPNIVLDKSNNDADGVVTAGQTVTYSLAVQNDNTVPNAADIPSNRVSTAYDTVVVDTVPPELIVQTASLTAQGGVFTPGATATDPGTITWNIATIAPGTTTTLTYDVVTATPLVASSALENTAVAETTSMPGVVPGERTVASPNGDADGDGYTDDAASTVTVPVLTLAKSADPVTATVGEPITYTVDVTIPGGVIAYDVTVIDDMPAGVTFESLTSVTCAQGAGACSPDLALVVPAGPTYASGTDIAFFFDDLTTAAAADRVVTITYVGFVSDAAAADDGSTLTNGATVNWNGTNKITTPPTVVPDPTTFDETSPEGSDSVATIEPSLAIDKDVTGQVADTDTRRAKPGDVLTYTVTVTNTGTAPAYDVTVSDIPTDDTWVFTDTTTTAGTVNTDADPGAVDGDGLEWTIDGPIAASGGTATITYTLTVPAGYDSSNEVVAGPEQSNTADVPSYFAVPEAERTANPDRDYRDYDDVAPDTVTIELDLASIGDDVWFDVNDDGIQQASEPVLPNVGVTVTYLGLDGMLDAAPGGDDEIFTTTTDANGKYLVEDLPGGEYIVDVDDTDTDIFPGLAPSVDLDDGAAATDGVSAATLGEDEDKRDVDFGYTGSGSIGNQLWFDQDLDGRFDLNEAPLVGVTVTLTYTSPNGDVVVYTDTTDANGQYDFPNLPAGDFTVTVDPLGTTVPDGYNIVSDPDGDDDNTTTVTLATGETNNDQDFGFAGLGSVGNFIWLDQSNDGDQDPGEPGLGGVMVQLTSFGPDGVSGGSDDSVFMTTTDANGGYLFSNLPPGEFEVEVTGALPANVVNTFDPDVDAPGDSTSSVTLTLAEPTDLDQDFGYYAASMLGDRVWLDVDNSGGVDDGTEHGINNVEVTATYFGPDGVLGGTDDEVFVTTTSGNGDYLFENIPDGNYQVQITGGIAPGLTQTFDSSGATTDGTSNTTLATEDLLQDFSYTGAGSIGDTIWFDSNEDGVLDAGETGLEGVTVTLTWYGLDGMPGGDDDIVLTATTNSIGKYSFPNLPDGEFLVVVDTSTLPVGMASTYDSDGLTATPDSSTPVTLAGGADIDTVDFGYSGAGSIGDTIWFDRDGDGVYDIGAEEYPLEGVTVELVWDSPTGPQTYLAQTDALGMYLFPNLPPGDYTVTVQTATLPAGMTPTFDGDQGANGLGNTSALTLGNGAADLAQDFGYRGSASIGDTIYLDLDGNGVQGPGEAGIAGQTVVLTWQSPSGPVTFTTTTDATGKYSFDNLPDGDYTVTVTGGIVDLATNTGDPTTPGPSVGDSTNNVTIAGGVSNTAQDFGYQGINSIGDTVFWDQGNDGVDDPTDPGIANVTVALVWFGLDGIEGTADDVTYPVDVTDATGDYGFTGLPDGSYSVAVTGGLPTGLDTNTFDGDDLTVNPNGISVVTDLGVGDAAPVADNDQDFGYAGTGSIGDTIYFDTNGNGAQNPGEPGIPGATVTLTWGGPDGDLATLGDNVTYPPQITGADGGYLYDNLPAGPFRVDVTNPLAGTTPTQDPNGGADNTSQVTLATGANNLVQDFGYTGTGSIGDTIWFDQNLDGIQNPGEDGLGGVGVTVTWAGPDGDLATTADNIEYSTTTTPAGKYLVNKLPAGNYSVVVDTGDLPADYTNVADPDTIDDSRSELVLGAGENNLVQDFGYSGSGSIGDTIYLDQNGDGDQDLGEPGLVGVTVQLVSFGPDGVLGGTDDSNFSTVTGPGGGYLFDNLPEGNYQVTVTGGITTVVNSDDPDLPAGPGVGNSVSTTTLTTAAPSDLDQDFGYFAISVLGDRVWWDRNGDGIQTADEPGFGGVEVELKSPSLGIPLTTTTNANGDYLFENIPNSVPGEEYTVRIISGVPGGLSQTFDAGGVGQTDETSTVALTDSDLVQDFGYNGSGSIGDTIWFDTDSSGGGAPDGAEFGLEGVTVTLTWTNPNGGDIVLTTVTDANGQYSFDNLPNGDFVIEVDESTLPVGLVATYDQDGNNDGSTPVTLTDAANTVDDVDFGYNGTGSIGDTIWFDRDGDGVFDANEYPLSDIEVTLTWNSTQGVETFTTTTNANGMYLFPNLAPGDYTVAVTTADLPTGMLPTFDADQDTNGLNSTSALVLGDGEDNEDQDFGYNGQGQIGDTVYLDLNGNGVQDPGEPGVANQTVLLGWVSPDGRVTFPVTTDENGMYLFDGLPAGDYDVTVVNGIVNDAVNTGDPGVAGPSIGDSTNTLTLTPGQVDLGQDFGYQGENTIGDRIWFDTNGDGVDDAGEPGLEGVEVTVVWFGPDNQPGTDDDVTLPTQLTDANGDYSFTGLPDGNFSVTVTDGLPAGLDTNTYDGDDLAVDPDGTSIVTGLGVGVTGPAVNDAQDFGYTGTGQIGDTIWLDLDLDGNGTQDPGEPGIPGVEVTLTGAGPDGVLGTADDVVYPTQTTGPDGTYLFENLPSGDFQVTVVNPVTGLTLSTDPDGTLDGTTTVDLDPGEVDLDQDFAYVGDASIGDTIFLDVDADGVQDTNEPGLGGITVTVTSAGADGILGTPDDIIVMVDTDADGVYLVDMLPAGPTSVTYDVDDLGVGQQPGSDLDGGDATTTEVVLGTGEDKRDVDFAVIGDATISGVVYQDTNGDGVQQPGEPGIGGVIVEVVFDGPDGPVVLTVTTNPDGTWSIPTVPSGDYVTTVIESSVPDGLVPSTPIDVPTVVPAGGEGVTDNGFVPTGSIGDTVFNDTDGDGVQDPGEPGIPGVTVIVTGPNGTTTVVTGTDGIYVVDDLPPGDYVVRVDPTTLPPGVVITADPDGNPDGTTRVTVDPGEDVTTIDFGGRVPPPAPGPLPKTGATIALTLAIAAMLLAAGWFLIGTTRRRRNHI